MSTPETELPFANSLNSITTEMLAEVSPDEIKDDVARMTARVGGKLSFDAIETFVGDSNIYRHYKGVVIAAVLTQTTLFEELSDKEKRYLLERALDADTLYDTGRLAYYETSQKYFRQDTGDSITAFMAIGRFTQNIKKREALKARLSKRATPSSPQMRK